MKVSQVLTSPEKWTKGVMAKTASRRMCNSTSHEAACWCLMGAAIRCTNANTGDACKAENTEQLTHPLRLAAGKLFPAHWRMCGFSLINFNDHPCTTFEMVQRVIQEAEKQNLT
jgi:hypothetical protein